jgi:predicted phage tail protein
MAFETDRPVSVVIGQIADNIQHIVRAEVRLARAEIADEITKAANGVVMIAVAAVAGAIGCALLLLAAVYALALVMPSWGAALTVGGATLLIAGVSAAVGMRRIRLPLPKTTTSIRETVEWAKTRVG